MNLLKSNYVSFFVVYSIISMINTLLTLYYPVFLLVVLKVNRIELAFIQFLSYLTLFLGPLIGFFFDKFTHMKKKLISISSAVLIFSFTFFNLNLDNLPYFGLFFALNFTSRLFIKAGMSKLMLEASDHRKTQKNIILISNISASFGSVIPIVIFNVLMYDINSLSFWSLFFNLCWIASLPILISFALINDKQYITPLNAENTILNKEGHNKRRISQFGLILIIFTNFLIWSDKLIEYPFTSWILAKYGESGFFSYSYLFFIFTYLYMGGWFVSRHFINQSNSNIYLSISISIYVLLMLCIIFTDLTTFLLITAINKVVSGIMMSRLTEKNIDISKLSKNTALSYELIRSSSLLANFIFVPLGTLLSLFISVESLIIIVALMSLTSIVPIFLHTRVLSLPS